MLKVSSIFKELLALTPSIAKCLDRKAHLFWVIPVVDAKVNELMDVLSFSGHAKYELSMPGETKDAKVFFVKKQHEEDNEIKPELSFVDDLFMMFKLRKKIEKAKAECRMQSF